MHGVLSAWVLTQLRVGLPLRPEQALEETCRFLDCEVVANVIRVPFRPAEGDQATDVSYEAGCTGGNQWMFRSSDETYQPHDGEAYGLIMPHVYSLYREARSNLALLRDEPTGTGAIRRYSKNYSVGNIGWHRRESATPWSLYASAHAINLRRYAGRWRIGGTPPGVTLTRTILGQYFVHSGVYSEGASPFSLAPGKATVGSDLQQEMLRAQAFLVDGIRLFASHGVVIPTSFDDPDELLGR